MNKFRISFFILFSVFVPNVIHGDELDTDVSTELLRIKKESLPSYDVPGDGNSESNYTGLDDEIFVVEGRKATSGEFSHMGAVGWRALDRPWKFLCGSSLISSKYMLTAAHCSKVNPTNKNVNNSRPEIVRLGVTNISDEITTEGIKVDAKIKRIIVHPEYDSPKRYFDIAVIELQYDVKFNDYIQPASLWSPTSKGLVGRKATVTGWGIYKRGLSETSLELRAAEVKIYDSQKCDEILKSRFRENIWSGMSESQICAGEMLGGPDACEGDSGGPLQLKESHKYHLIGIISFGYRCGLENTPAVYTRVSSFIDWIEDIVGPLRT